MASDAAKGADAEERDGCQHEDHMECPRCAPMGAMETHPIGKFLQMWFQPPEDDDGIRFVWRAEPSVQALTSAEKDEYFEVAIGGAVKPQLPDGLTPGDVAAEFQHLLSQYGEADVTYGEVDWSLETDSWQVCLGRYSREVSTLTEALTAIVEALESVQRREPEERRQPPTSDAVRHLGTADMPGRGTGWE